MVDHNVIFDSLLGNKMSGNALDQVIILLDGDKMHTTTRKPMSTIAWAHQTHCSSLTFCMSFHSQHRHSGLNTQSQGVRYVVA